MVSGPLSRVALASGQCFRGARARCPCHPEFEASRRNGATTTGPFRCSSHEAGYRAENNRTNSAIATIPSQIPWPQRARNRRACQARDRQRPGEAGRREGVGVPPKRAPGAAGLETLELDAPSGHVPLPLALFPDPCHLSPIFCPLCPVPSAPSYAIRHPKFDPKNWPPPLRGVASSLVLRKNVRRVGGVAGRIGDRQLAGLTAELLNWPRRDANLQVMRGVRCK